ncbi:MAG: hypothetical protein ACTSYC_04090 [Promethearchaeota archaeon]
MDNFAMVRNFDQAGYYETRMILLIFALALSLYFMTKKKDKNYIVIFLSSAIFFSIVELIMTILGMRAENWTISIFGLIIPSYLTWIVQGFGEGCIYGVSGFLFLDMYLKRADKTEYNLRRNLFIVDMVLVFGCSIIIGIVAYKRPITSVRPMFGVVQFLYLTSVIIISIILAKFYGGPGFFKMLAYYLLGSFLFIVINLEFLQFIDVRYIGVLREDGTVVKANLGYQILIMVYSYLYEITLPRAHYLVVPVALGLIKLKEI